MPRIADEVVVQNSSGQDIGPAARVSRIFGAHQTVATLANLTDGTIPTFIRVQGMEVKTLDTSITYSLSSDLVTWIPSVVPSAVFLVSNATGNLYSLSLKTRTLSAAIATASDADFIALSPNRKQLAVACYGGQAYYLLSLSGLVKRQFLTPGYYWGSAAFSPDSQTLWLTSWNATKGLFPVTVSTGALGSVVSTPGTIHHITFTASGRLVGAIFDLSEVLIIDTNATQRTVSVQALANGICSVPNTELVLAASVGNGVDPGYLNLIDCNLGTVIASSRTGVGPRTPAVAGSICCVCNYNDKTVMLYSLPSLSLLATYDTSAINSNIQSDMTSDMQTIVVTSTASGKIALIDILSGAIDTIDIGSETAIEGIRIV